jgi:PAS domain S-box-containing protein
MNKNQVRMGSIAVFLTLIFGFMASYMVQSLVTSSVVKERRMELESQVSSLTLLAIDKLGSMLDQTEQLAYFWSTDGHDGAYIEYYFRDHSADILKRMESINSLILFTPDRHSGEFNAVYHEKTDNISDENIKSLISYVAREVNALSSFEIDASGHSEQRVLFPPSAANAFQLCVVSPLQVRNRSNPDLFVTCSHLKDLLDPVLMRSSHDWLDIFVYSGNVAKGYKQIYFFSAHPEAAQLMHPANAERDGSVFLPQALSVGNSSLSMLYQPQDSYYSSFNWQHYLPMILGTILTLTMCLYIAGLGQKNAEINATVELRTRELMDAKAALESQIEERTKLYEEIHKNSEQLVALTNSIDGVLWEADPKTLRFTYISDQVERILGYSVDEYMSGEKKLGHVHVAGHDKNVINMIRERSDGPDTFQIEYEGQRADGSAIWIRNVITKEVVGDELKLIRGVLMDISSQKEQEMNAMNIEAQLRHSQKLEAIGQLAAGIAHEINTPSQFVGDNINFLKSSFGDIFDLVNTIKEKKAANDADIDVESLLDEHDFDYLKEEIPESIDQSLEGISRVSKIVNAMKDFSHPGSADKQKIDLNRSIESTVIVARNEWKYLADLDMHFADHIPLVECLPGELNQTILNMIVNASHAIEEKYKGSQKGHIEITTNCDRENVTVTITDDGAGIPQHVIDKVFDPFFTTKEVGKGTGQGLAIAYSVIVDKHGGTLSVTSTPGEGTCFTITLPCE